MEVSNDINYHDIMSQTLLFFDGKDTQPGMMNVHIDEEVSSLGTEEASFNSVADQIPFNATENMCVQNDIDISNQGGIVNTDESSFNSDKKEPPFNVKGVLMSIYTYTVFHYCFSVQETITTPMVIKLYDWSATQINLLFAGAGAISLVTSLSVRYGARRIRDQTLLIAGISIGLLGSILQMDIPQIEKVLPVGRCIVGFMLTYIAYSIGRNVVLGIFSNILGPSSQGAWMGVIVAAGAMTRAFVPFVAWHAVEVVHWRTWLEFGLSSLFLLLALVGSIMIMRFLVPYSEFVGLHTVPDDKMFDRFPTRTSSLTTPLLDNSE